MFDYNKIPDRWAMCPQSDCRMAETCLRHQVFLQARLKFKRWMCVLPNPEEEGDCKSYQKAEMVMMAQGFASIYQNVQSREARAKLRRELTDFFGSKGTYYRYRDGERLINPQMQQDIIDIVHRYAPDVEVFFDNTFMDYDFTRC